MNQGVASYQPNQPPHHGQTVVEPKLPMHNNNNNSDSINNNNHNDVQHLKLFQHHSDWLGQPAPSSGWHDAQNGQASQAPIPPQLQQQQQQQQQQVQQPPYGYPQPQSRFYHNQQQQQPDYPTQTLLGSSLHQGHPQPGMVQPPQLAMVQPPQPGMVQPQQSAMMQPPRPSMMQPPQPGMVQPPQLAMLRPPQPGMMQPPRPGIIQPPQPPKPASQPAQQQLPPPQQQQQQQQSRSLDPDQMPSAVQVMEDDSRRRSGVYETGQQPGQPPPLVTTDFAAVDCGSCSPRYMRSTLYAVPCTRDLLKLMHVPLGLAVSPMAARAPGESALRASDPGTGGPVRCTRCKAYMSPHMTWLDGGRRFQCGLCAGTTETPEAYFALLDHTGRRVDAGQRPELHQGSYELLATAEYCKGGKPASGPPGIIFAIDVGYRAVRSGLTGLVCDHIKRKILSLLPTEEGEEGRSQSPLRVGFITYDRTVHYYNLSPGLSRPQMLLATDLAEPFVPLVSGFLVSPADSEAQIAQLLESIPVQFAQSVAPEDDPILGPVVEGALDAFKSAGCPGKLVIFHTGLPTAEAPGRLKNRDDRKLLGTDKEKAILCPAGDYYTRLGQRCVESGVGVDMFVCCDAYVDLASIGQVAFTSGGSLYKYASFQAGTHDRQLTRDLEYSIANCRAFDCVMRVRTSAGIRPVDFYGGMYMANATDMETGVFASDRAVAIELKHDDKLPEGQPALIQCALLYTGVSGQRRVRVHNLALATASQLADAYRSADLDAVVSLLAKSAFKMLLRRGPKETRDSLVTRCVNILAAYRKHCAANSSAGQLILPEVLKLLPLYVNALIKNDAFQGADISTDDRSYLMYLCAAMDVPASNVYFYPRLMPVHDLTASPVEAPVETAAAASEVRQLPPRCIRCSVERLTQKGAYLLENGIVMFLWLGPNIDVTWLQSVFGVNSLSQLNADKSELPEIDTPVSKQIRGLIQDIRQKRRRHLRLYVVRARDKLEPWFANFLVEDRGVGGAPPGDNGGGGGRGGVGASASYVDFLLHVHKEIRSLLG